MVSCWYVEISEFGVFCILGIEIRRVQPVLDLSGKNGSHHTKLPLLSYQLPFSILKKQKHSFIRQRGGLQSPLCG